jgi:predicted phosphoribosyltransferase
MSDALTQPFVDRRDAGQLLAQQLRHYSYRPDVDVLALPPSGVPVAYEVATVLGVRLGVFPARQVGVPGQPELTMAAVAPGGIRVLDQKVIDYFAVPLRTVDVVAQAEERELERSRSRMNQPLELRARTIILVDDDLATGVKMQAAILAGRLLGAARVVIATPVGALPTYRRLAPMADEAICARQPLRCSSVAHW